MAESYLDQGFRCALAVQNGQVPVSMVSVNAVTACQINFAKSIVVPLIPAGSVAHVPLMDRLCDHHQQRDTRLAKLFQPFDAALTVLWDFTPPSRIVGDWQCDM
jgi:hypothetical protein